MNEFKDDLPDTVARSRSEQHLDGLRQQGGIFVDAVRLTRMPMIVTDATLPGNPITFANQAFVELCGYDMDELLGQEPHFMNGPGTDPEAIDSYVSALEAGRDVHVEILQYRKDGTPLSAMLFASALNDGQGTVTNHFLSYLDITARREAEDRVAAAAAELEERVAARTSELEAANAALTRASAEREMLMVEVNHRAKNSLAVAGSLLRLQGRRQLDPAVKAMFDESAGRVGAMGQLHDLLSRSEHADRIDVATYIAELCEALKSLTGEGERIALRVRAEEDILVAADTAFPMGIIVTELVTNAVKYAFPAGRSGTIVVQARRSGPGRVEVVVRDNGVGMADFREGSLGYGLVRALVKQMGGEIAIQGDAGVTVTLHFPDASRVIEPGRDAHVAETAGTS